jgi:hypothetical protein
MSTIVPRELTMSFSYILLAVMAAIGCAASQSIISAQPSTCSSTPQHLIYYTSGSSTFTVASCSASTVYMSAQESNAYGTNGTLTASGLQGLATVTVTETPSQCSTVGSISGGYITQQTGGATTVYLTQTPSPITTTVYASQPASSLPPCSSAGSGSTNSSCQDANGNEFNVTYGTLYNGNVASSTATPDVDTCLHDCDQTSGCIAVNWVNGTCSLLSSVTGTQPVAFGNAQARETVAAMRPSDVTTTYTAPTSTTTQQVPVTTTVVSTASPVTTTAYSTIVSYANGTAAAQPSPSISTYTTTFLTTVSSNFSASPTTFTTTAVITTTVSQSSQPASTVYAPASTITVSASGGSNQTVYLTSTGKSSFSRAFGCTFAF